MNINQQTTSIPVSNKTTRDGFTTYNTCKSCIGNIIYFNRNLFAQNNYLICVPATTDDVVPATTDDVHASCLRKQQLIHLNINNIY